MVSRDAGFLDFKAKYTSFSLGKGSLMRERRLRVDRGGFAVHNISQVPDRSAKSSYGLLLLQSSIARRSDAYFDKRSGS